MVVPPPATGMLGGVGGVWGVTLIQGGWGGVIQEGCRGGGGGECGGGVPPPPCDG